MEVSKEVLGMEIKDFLKMFSETIRRVAEDLSEHEIQEDPITKIILGVGMIVDTFAKHSSECGILSKFLVDDLVLLSRNLYLINKSVDEFPCTCDGIS